MTGQNRSGGQDGDPRQSWFTELQGLDDAIAYRTTRLALPCPDCDEVEDRMTITHATCCCSLSGYQRRDREASSGGGPPRARPRRDRWSRTSWVAGRSPTSGVECGISRRLTSRVRASATFWRWSVRPCPCGYGCRCSGLTEVARPLLRHRWSGAGPRRGRAHHQSCLCEIWDPARACAVVAPASPVSALENDVRTLRALPRRRGAGDRQASPAPTCRRLEGRRASRASSPAWWSMFFVCSTSITRAGWCWRMFATCCPLTRVARCVTSYRSLSAASTTGPIEWSIQGSLGFPREGREYFSLLARLMTLSTVLLSDDAGEAGPEHYAQDAFGFYWTEGLRGLGWARDATPTLKGGSTIGIPSPPGIWIPGAPLGRQLVTPSVEDAEALQGFARGWTSSACDTRGRKGPRWKLVGNAVTVGVAEWLGRRLACPGSYDGSDAVRMSDGDRWPSAAWGTAEGRWSSQLSMWPERRPYKHLSDAAESRWSTPAHL